MDPTLVESLKNVFPSPSSYSTNPTVFLDQNTSIAFDNSYYQQLQLKHGILLIDQELTSDGSTNGIVMSLASDGITFSKSFVGAIVKMGNIEVLTGKNGEIRTNCRVVTPISSK
jgi:peroxidase